MFISKIIYLARFLFIAVSLGSVAAFSFAGTVNNIPDVVWVQSFGDDRFEHTAYAMNISPLNGNVLIAGASSLAGRSGEQGSFWVWEISKDNGKVVREINIKKHENGSVINQSYVYIKSMAVTLDNNILLVVEFKPGHPFIVVVDEQGKVLVNKPITDPPGDRVITKIIPLNDKSKNFLLVGRDAKNALIIKLDRAGNKLWQKTLDRGKAEAIYDGVALQNGSVLLLGNSSTWITWQPGPSDIWLFKLDHEGKVVSEEIFAGRYGSITKVKGDKYMVVYDKSVSNEKNIWAVRLNSALKKEWEKQIVKMRHVLARFHVQPVLNGDVLIAGTNDAHKIWVSRISQEGQERWVYSGDMQNKSLETVNFLSSNTDFFLLTAVYSEDKNRQANFKIGLVKFKQQ